MASETSEYTIILVRTSDPSIGVIIAIPKTRSLEFKPEIWKELKEAMAKSANKAAGYKEIWIPGFSVKCGFETEVSLGKVITEGKHLRSIKEAGQFEIYSPAPHDGGLLIDNVEDFLVIEKDFIIGKATSI